MFTLLYTNPNYSKLPSLFLPQVHFPGFIKNADALRQKGVSEIYCLSVNDAYVMQAYGDSLEGCWDSGCKLIADGNGEVTKAMNLVLDCSDYRMGNNRCVRFGAIVENGLITTLNIDKDDLKDSSVESILAALL